MRKSGTGVLQRLSDFKVRKLDGKQRYFQVSLDYWDAPHPHFSTLPLFETERVSQIRALGLTEN